MMERSMRTVLLLRLFTIVTLTISMGSCNGNLAVLCKESERDALLKFRQDLKDPANRLLSWGGGGDCCKWTGVVCDNITGHILELHLSKPDSVWVKVNPILGSKINPSLLILKHLRYLDLSKNDFQGIQIPAFFGSLKSLRYLNLSYAGFEGTIPHQLGNLSCLRDLHLDNYNGVNIVESLHWISGLSQLEYLDMSRVNLSKASDHWLQVINKHAPLFGRVAFVPMWFLSLRNLASLDLFGCGFQGPIPGSPHNITSLREIDLAQNSLTLPIPEWLFNHRELTLLRLGYNHFGGPFPSGIVNMTGLKTLHLESNNFHSSIPKWLYSLKNLESIRLSSNKLDGEILSDIGNLTSIAELNLDDNLLKGKIPNTMGYLRELISLDLSTNNFNGNNQLYGEIQNIDAAQGSTVDLSFNQFNGSLPVVSSAVDLLDLSNSSFSGSVFHFFCDKIDIPKRVSFLLLGNNLLSGNIPDCWKNWGFLQVLNLGNNNLSGNILSSLGSLNLRSLHLRNNSLSGELPPSLMYSMNMRVLDLGENKFVGSLPAAMIENGYSSLVVLNLRSNKLHGDIPDELCALNNLQILDLADNNLSGTIPRCFQNFSAMVVVPISDGSIEWLNIVDYGRYIDSSFLVTKGREVEYSKILGWVTSMDLSANAISGEMPEELTSLISLQNLNISGNHR
ncbi:hypothetical protein ACLB2K_075941 [Fragaria x ananassa]